jgi:hypothetical protein
LIGAPEPQALADEVGDQAPGGWWALLRKDLGTGTATPLLQARVVSWRVREFVVAFPAGAFESQGEAKGRSANEVLPTGRSGIDPRSKRQSDHGRTLPTKVGVEESTVALHAV